VRGGVDGGGGRRGGGRIGEERERCSEVGGGVRSEGFRRFELLNTTTLLSSSLVSPLRPMERFMYSYRKEGPLARTLTYSHRKRCW